MTALVLLLLKVTVVLAAGLLLARVLRRRAAAARHAVLLAAVIAALIMPLAALVAPTWGPVARLAPSASETPAAVVVSTSPIDRASDPAGPGSADVEVPGIAPATAAGLSWLVVAGVALVRLGRAAHRLRGLARESRLLQDERWLSALDRMRARAGVDADVQLRVGAEDAPIVTWGLRQPRVLIPAQAVSWADDRVEHVLAHELAHIARRDWAWHLVFAVGAAIYCWHPLMRLAVRQAYRDAEHACDDAVLATGAAASAYASTLLDVARTSPSNPAIAMPAMADASSLERRIAAMLDTSLDHTHKPRRVRALGVGFVLAVGIAVAGLSAQAQGTGVVNGTVLPAGGTPIADVAITFTGSTTVTTTTDAGGRYSATLPAGTYRATIRKPGFKAFEARVDVPAGGSVARDFALALGQVQESINVRGGGAARPLSERTRELTGPPPPRPQGTLAPPLKMKDVRPVYDEALKAAGVAGKVVVEARIGADGYVTDTRVVSTPDDRLSASALEAIEQWRFAPTLLQGKPVATDMLVTIEYLAQK